MKVRLAILSILLIVFAVSLTAQETTDASSDEINVKEFLDKQINEIKEKQDAPVNTAPNKDANLYATITNIMKQEAAVKIFIILEAIFVAALVIIWRRRKMTRTENRAVLKINISKLREEKIGSVEDKRLTQIRTGLAYKPIAINNTGSGITAAAKRLAISKGEVHLAAKIKILANKR